MKKLIISAFLAIAALNAYSMEAKVVSAKGKAEVQNGNVWIALQSGDTLQKGAVIQTGFKSELVLQIKATTVTVSPLSRMTIEQLAEKDGVNGAPGKDETRVFLDTGSLKSNVKKSADRRVGFTVKSPVATASVRGTIPVVKIGYKSTKISAEEGLVAVWNSKNSAPAVSTDEEDNTPVQQPLTGASASDVSDDAAPKGAFLVAKGQASSVAQSGKTEKPAETAKKEAVALSGSTQTAAAVEAVTTGEVSAVSVAEETASAKASGALISVKTILEK